MIKTIDAISFSHNTSYQKLNIKRKYKNDIENKISISLNMITRRSLVDLQQDQQFDFVSFGRMSNFKIFPNRYNFIELRGSNFKISLLNPYRRSSFEC